MNDSEFKNIFGEENLRGGYGMLSEKPQKRSLTNRFGHLYFHNQTDPNDSKFGNIFTDEHYLGANQMITQGPQPTNITNHFNYPEFSVSVCTSFLSPPVFGHFNDNDDLHYMLSQSPAFAHKKELFSLPDYVKTFNCGESYYMWKLKNKKN
jgi:hypothetical protein